MNRTRSIFFLVLAAYLGVIATTLLLKIADAQFLTGLFIASTIFSVGVVLLDFLGVLGGHHPGDTAGDVTVGHFIGDHTGDVSAAHGDAGGHGAGDHTAADHGHAGESHAAPILSALTYLRLFVYFCLGFGPMGWAAMVTGRSPLVSLLLAAPIGIAAVFLAQAFFRFQRRDTDSQVRGADLVGQRGTVIVPLDDRTMGRVRIQVGPVILEQYALAAQPGAAFERGAEVMVASVTDECVYVR